MAWLVAFPGTAFSQVSFNDVSTSAGMTYQGETYGAAWGELNGDALPDLFANNHQTRPSLYVNQGNGTFVDIGGNVTIWKRKPTMDTHGGSWADVENDGDLDLIVTTGRGNPSQFFINEGGTLVYSPDEYGLGDIIPAGRLHVWFDYDLDGLLDNVLNSWSTPSDLLKGSGTGFTSNSNAVNFYCVKGHYGLLVDVTGDKVLDYVCPADTKFPNRIWDVTTSPSFTDVTNRIPSVQGVSDAIVGDFDGDQRNDLFIVPGNMRKSQAIKSDGNSVEANLALNRSFSFVTAGSIDVFLDVKFIESDGNFSNIKIGANGFSPGSIPFTLDAADPNVAGMPTLGANPPPTILIGYNSGTGKWTMEYKANSGSMAYFVVDSTANVSNVAAQGLGGREKATAPTLLLNTASGFVDSTSAAGLGAKVSCVSAATGDFDNDRDLDIYLVCTGGAENLENILYLNNGNGVFTALADAGGAAGVTGPAIGSGAGTGENVAIADFDVDGFLDLFVTNGLNMRPKVLGGPDHLFRNQGNNNHWVQLDLVGNASNRDAVGARVYATAGGKTQLRVQNGGYHRWAQHHMRIHVGLGSSQKVDLTVEWPSGLVNQYNNVAADALYRVTEGAGIVVVDVNGSGGGGGTPPSSCGEPAYNPAVTAGLILWQNCSTGVWEARGTAGGGSYTTYSGGVVSDQAFSNVSPVSLEAADILDATTDPLRIDFLMGVSGKWEDGFSFSYPGAANVCFGRDMPAGAVALVGPSLTPVTLPFDLATLGACGASGSGCGAPVYDPASDTALIVYQECGTGAWHVQATAGAGFKKYKGNVSSAQALSDITPISIEASDTLNVAADSKRIDFTMRVAPPWEDGFSFIEQAGSDTCVTLNAPAGATILYGADRQPVSSPFALATGAPCP